MALPRKTHNEPASSRTAFDVLSDQMINGQNSCIEVASKNLEIARETHTIMDNVVETLNKEIDRAMKLITWLVVALLVCSGIQVVDLVGWI